MAYLLGGLNRGGAEIMALNTVANSGSSGLDFICIYRKTGTLYNEFNNLGTELINLSPKSTFDIVYIFRLRKILKANRVQIVHAHQVLDSVIAILATLFTRIKTVQTFHGHGLTYSFSMRVMRRIALRYNRINIFVSNSQLDAYKQRFSIPSNKALVIYNGILISNSQKAKSSSIRSELNFPDDDFLIGTVGNFSDGRDPITLCRFILKLRESGFNFKYLFIGGKSKSEPDIYDECVNFCRQNKLEENVLFLGVRIDVPVILPQLDAFIYSTKHDTFSLALFEGIFASVPVFTNDWGVFVELTENGKLATLYKSKDEQDLLDKFLNFIGNKEEYIKKAQLASEIVKEKYSIKAHIKMLKKAYQKVLNS